MVQTKFSLKLYSVMAANSIHVPCSTEVLLEVNEHVIYRDLADADDIFLQIILKCNVYHMGSDIFCC